MKNFLPKVDFIVNCIIANFRRHNKRKIGCQRTADFLYLFFNISVFFVPVVHKREKSKEHYTAEPYSVNVPELTRHKTDYSTNKEKCNYNIICK